MAKTDDNGVAPPATVTRSISFAATVVRRQDGTKHVRLASPSWHAYQIGKLREGEAVTLEVHTRRPKRTEQQNRYYWGVYLPLIAEETGERDIDALHELFKGKFLSEGITEVLGEKVRKKKSTTDLGVADFCEYIIAIENLTSVAAPPTENYDLAPLSEGAKKEKEP